MRGNPATYLTDIFEVMAKIAVYSDPTKWLYFPLLFIHKYEPICNQPSWRSGVHLNTMPQVQFPGWSFTVGVSVIDWLRSLTSKHLVSHRY